MTTTKNRDRSGATRHSLAALTVGAVLAAGATACAAPDPIEAYLVDARAAATQLGATAEFSEINAESPDGALLFAGALVCGFSADGNSFAPAIREAAATSENPMTLAALEHCDTAFAQPLTPEQRERYGFDQFAEAFGAADPAAAEDVAVTADPMSSGERFNVMGNDQTALASAAITAIEVDPDCSDAERYTSTLPTPENGHFIAVQMDVATTADYDANLFSYPTGHDFTITGPDGYTVGQTYADDLCIADRDSFGTPMVASSKYRGWILLDAPAATGTLTFRPHFAPSSYAGVTIELPASGATSAPAESEVTETSEDFAQWRANIEANGGEPSNSAESQYIYACEQGTLPPADCP